MLGIIVISITTIFFLMYFLERRTMLLGGVFLLWAIITTVYIILTLETYEKHLAIIVAFIVFTPTVFLFPFYFVSFIILLISSGIQLINREGRKIRNFLSITLGIFFVVWAIISPFFTVHSGMNLVWMEIYLVITFSVYYFIFTLLLFAVSSLLNRIPISF